MCALIKFNGAVSPLYNQNIYAAAYVLLRHTFCTRMILGGIDLKTVQIIMGHADAETTMRVYANVTKAQAQNEMMRMEGKMKLK